MSGTLALPPGMTSRAPQSGQRAVGEAVAASPWPAGACRTLVGPESCLLWNVEPRGALGAGDRGLTCATALASRRPPAASGSPDAQPRGGGSAAAPHHQPLQPLPCSCHWGVGTLWPLPSGPGVLGQQAGGWSGLPAAVARASGAGTPACLSWSLGSFLRHLKAPGDCPRPQGDTGIRRDSELRLPAGSEGALGRAAGSIGLSPPQAHRAAPPQEPLTPSARDRSPEPSGSARTTRKMRMDLAPWPGSCRATSPLRAPQLPPLS